VSKKFAMVLADVSKSFIVMNKACTVGCLFSHVSVFMSSLEGGHIVFPVGCVPFSISDVPFSGVCGHISKILCAVRSI
jgi:hypothetical protein